MERARCKLPVGIENFQDIRTEGFYYIDKTGFIKNLLEDWAKVNLFTRPRRFGKTLTMSMLRTFLEIGTDPSLFDGLAISKETALCQQYMGKFPVIFVSLKSVNGLTFDSALEGMSFVIRREARRFQFLLESEKLTDFEKNSLLPFLQGNLDTATQKESLTIFSELLYKHFGQKVIILIDEYDVPLDKAYQNGYYEEMVNYIRSMFEMALKTNDYLQFAVLTGCLRISKESIFTGLNNFNVHTISDTAYDEYFGFTDAEVKALLDSYNLSSHYPDLKEWYDGYCFGSENIYCPWDVVCYTKELLFDEEAEPASYWANSSENAIIKNMIEHANNTVRNEIELLISGETLKKELVYELTYKDLDTTNTNERLTYLWSILYTTGYLTDAARPRKRLHQLVIPNQEINEIFENQVRRWFHRLIQSDKSKLKDFCSALKNGDAEGLQLRFNEYLQQSISIRDSFIRKDLKENFFHGVLVGLFSSEDTWIVRSNSESGKGYSDILVKIPAEKIGCVIEVKYAENRSFETMCKEAMTQIMENDYAARLRDDGMETIYAYGIACYLKECRVIHKKLT